VVEVEAARAVSEKARKEAEDRSGKEMQRTVFVNAANEPMGRTSWAKNGWKVKPGGPGFRPVVVDLKD